MKPIDLSTVEVDGKRIPLDEAEQLAYGMDEHSPKGKDILHQCALNRATILMGDINARSHGRPVIITGGVYHGKSGKLVSRDMDIVMVNLDDRSGYGGIVEVLDEHAKVN